MSANTQETLTKVSVSKGLYGKKDVEKKESTVHVLSKAHGTMTKNPQPHSIVTNEENTLTIIDLTGDPKALQEQEPSIILNSPAKIMQVPI